MFAFFRAALTHGGFWGGGADGSFQFPQCRTVLKEARGFLRVTLPRSGVWRNSNPA